MVSGSSHISVTPLKGQEMLSVETSPKTAGGDWQGVTLKPRSEVLGFTDTMEYEKQQYLL